MDKKLFFSNTYNSGNIRILIYKLGDEKEFIGVALEFGLVIKAKSLEKAEECIKDVTKNYLRTVIEKKLSEELLNRPAQKKYWAIYIKAIKENEKLANLSFRKSPRIPSPQIEIPFILALQNYQNGYFNFN